MGKKKNAAKHQGKAEGGGGGEANGRGQSSHANHHSGSRSPKAQGRSSPKTGQGNNSAPASSSSSTRRTSAPSSSSSSSSSSLPESRLPWRLLLVVSLVAGGAAILCVNEPVKSLIEDAYLTHAQPHILSVAQALGLLQEDTTARTQSPPTQGQSGDKSKGREGEKASSGKSPEAASSNKKAAATADPPEAQQAPPTQPVVEEIRVKTTPPKAQEGRSAQPSSREDATHTAQHPEKQADKPTETAQQKKPDSKATQETSEQMKPSAEQTENLPEVAGTGESSEEGAYAKANITNAYDFNIRHKLDKAEELLTKDRVEEALKMFEQLLAKHPKSPRALLGRADSLDKLAFKKRSNEVLEQSIVGYERLVYHGEDVTPPLMKLAGRTLAKKQQFRGWGIKAARTKAYLSQLFPEDLELQRERGLGHLLAGEIDKSQEVFEKILKTNPDDGFSLVHLGFILKTSRDDNEGGITLLQKGIDSGHEGTQNGRFYFQLGDAYYRTGKDQKAREVYEEGARKGLFLSADQRSLYNVDRLTSRPWWTKEQTGYQQYLQLLEDNWRVIRDEAMKQLDNSSGLFTHEAEKLREKGNWKQLTLYQQGRQNAKVCALVPKTCELIEQIPDAKGCKRGQVKFSVIHPGTHVWAHCGPTNCRLRAHLGLIVPQGIRIRVVNETRTWEEGKFLIFDDSFEHEVWHEGESLRMVLIVDFWHPDLTAQEKRTLVPI